MPAETTGTWPNSMSGAGLRRVPTGYPQAWAQQTGITPSAWWRCSARFASADGLDDLSPQSRQLLAHTRRGWNGQGCVAFDLDQDRVAAWPGGHGCPGLVCMHNGWWTGCTGGGILAAILAGILAFSRNPCQCPGQAFAPLAGFAGSFAELVGAAGRGHQGGQTGGCIGSQQACGPHGLHDTAHGQSHSGDGSRDRGASWLR